MAMARLRSITCFVFYFAIIINAQYVDDVDYNVDFYEDLPIDYAQNFEKNHPTATQDDFYILSDFEDGETHLKTDNHYEDTNDIRIEIGSDGARIKGQKSFDWYSLPERVYRYTKHRIPGYDYDELDYVGGKGNRVCDERSVWTHCLCQFTCSEPDIVDCYTPCKSGCECKEDYVFDEKTQQCLPPEECQGGDNFVYNKR